MQRKQVMVDGTSVNVYEAGSGTGLPVLFLHGVGGNGKVWMPLMRPLREQGRLLAVDLPGFTDGTLPASIRTLSDYPSLFGRLLDELEIRAAVWVGNSLGGRIALEAALQLPERVLGLGLIGSAGVRAQGCPAVRLDELTEEEFNLRAFRHPEKFTAFERYGGKRDAGREGARALYARLADATDWMDFTPLLAEVHVPVRVIWGRYDGILPVELGEKLAAGIPGAVLTVLEEAAHAPHLEAPGVVTRELARLLAQVVEGGGGAGG